MKNKLKVLHKYNIGKRAISLATAAVLLTGSLPFDGIIDGVSKLSSVITAHAADPIHQSITFYDLDTFVDEYASEYAAHDDEWCEDTLIFSLDASKNTMPSDFVSLGTSEHPFNGKIYFTQTGNSEYSVIKLDKPFFEYVTDSVVINKNGTNSPIQLNIQRTSDLAEGVDSPLLANHVKHNSSGSSATWIIKSEAYDDGQNNFSAYAFSGIIGTMEKDAHIALEFENGSKNTNNNSCSDITAYNAVGVICGTMDTGSHIELKMKAGINTAGKIESSNSHAGGLVGEMKSGSILEIKSYAFIPAVDREIHSNKTGNGTNTCAGGLVGFSNGGRVLISNDFSGTVTVKDKIIGQTAAGGVFGSYKNAVLDEGVAKDSFDLSNYSINCKASASSVGGVFGVVETSDDLTVKNGSLTIAKSDTSGAFAGVAGIYKTNNHLKTFEVNSVTVNTSAGSTTSYGGVAGEIQNGTSADYAYVKVIGFTHNSTGGSGSTLFGGVVGKSDLRGNFLDIGTVTISTNNTRFTGGGLVGDLSKGVLRLSGTTTMTNAPSANSDNDHRNRGQLVGKRVDALVYSLGDGSDESPSYGNGWRYVRSSMDVHADDIGTWGEVLRIGSVETNIVTPDLTNHTVTLLPCDPTVTIDSDILITKLALNIQLNKGSSVDALVVSSTNASKRDSLLSNTGLTISGSIDLSGTGITGLMRDDYDSSAATEVGYFTGKITGTNSATVKLAIGERYGVYTGDSPVGRGAIFNHRLNGLLAITGSGAQVSSLVIDSMGSDETPENYGWNINKTANYTYVGGVTAQVTGGLTLTDVDCIERINYNALAGSVSYIGGFIGEVSSANSSAVTIQKSSNTTVTVSPTIIITGDIKTHTGGQNEPAVQHAIGGAIGIINSKNAFTTTISDATISATIDASEATAVADIATAGLIADIVANGTTDNRTLALTNVTADGVQISNTATSHSGGILGYQWLNTNVTMTNVALSKSGDTVNTIDTNANYLGGLVMAATGHWTIPSGGLTIDSFSDDRSSATSFGMIVNDGYSGSAGLFLELTAVDSYTISTSDVTVPDASVYDELVAYTSSSANYLRNGKDNNVGVGIISITTSTPSGSSEPTLIMDTKTGTKAKTNSYQNKLNTDTNMYSRYYYNISTIRNKAAADRSDGEKLLLWSLNHYAASNLTAYFPNAYAVSGKADKIIGTDFDMLNLSYYPIDIVNDTVLGDISISFYNSYIENSESTKVTPANGDTDNISRSSVNSDTQHYLMHFGLFKNVSANLTTSGNIVLSGNIGNDDYYSGALISGTLTGTLETASDKEVVLNGIELKDSEGYLLINKIGNKAILKLNKVRTGGSEDFNGDVDEDEIPYDSDGIASSLIGSVKGNGIQLEFKSIKLDARNETNDESYTGFNDIYGTTTSIFTDATLIAEFDVDSGSSAIYEFEESEDWNGSTHIGNVTYGQEIITSEEFKDKQQKYIDQTNFVHPFAGTPSGKYSDFETDFLPYVASSTALNVSDTREIRVNVKISGLTIGCGTYNHPYEISLDDQLPTVAQAIAGTGYPVTLRLPKINGSAMASLNHWSDSCEIFSTSGGDYTFSETIEGTTTTYTWTRDQVRLYLASAYYMITKNITLDSSFTGLGSVAGTNVTGKYSFRGVIVGANENITITNKAKRIDNTDGKHSNTPGLISMSNGSVVKDLIIKVEIDRSSYASNAKYDYKTQSLVKYEYNEACPNYGAVINKIMGGDNIIDNVRVDFNGDFNVKKSDQDYSATIGGYVGCVVNGGLVFKNVSDASLTTTVGETITTGFTVNKVNDDGTDSSYTVNGVGITNMTNSADLAHLYVNPFVGRVINGYVIKETNGSYNISENGKYSDPDMTSANNTRSGVTEVTMHNTRKNYVITDIDASQNYQSSEETKRNSVLTFKEKTTDSGLYNKIEVPNSQALFIMSIIAQSGVGCAGSDTANSENGNYAYTISFDGAALRSYSGNKAGDTYKASRHASYNDIGSDASKLAGSDYDISKLDTVNSQTAVPYIIYKYTSSYSSEGTTYYPARSLTKRYFYIELTGNGTYYLPDAFRGIGFIGSDSADDAMKIYGLNGNGKTIDMNSMLYHYLKGYDAFYSGANINMNSGLAFFNRLNQYCADPTYRSYYTNTDNQIYSFTLSGYISADCLTDAGAEFYKVDESGGIFRTGGLISFADSEKYYNIANITLNNFHVKSCEYAGGLVARVNTSKIYINNCNATNLKVEGYCRTGGFIGNNNGSTKYDGVFINTANDSASSTLSNITVLHNGKTDNKFSCVGGVIGQFYTSQTDLNALKSNSNYGHVIIRNVTITDSRIESVQTVGKAGGIMGCLQQSTASLFLDCNIVNTNISGKYSGGIIGDNTANSDVYGMRIVNCTVSGSLNETTHLPNYSIYGTQYVGGIIGYDKSRSQNENHYPKYNNTSYKLNVEGCSVENYKVYGISSGNGGSGGIAGTVDKVGTNYVFRIANTKVSNCVIQNASSQTNRGVGAIIGYNATSGKIVQGTNIVAYNNTVQNTANSSDGLVGNLIGNANSSLIFKIVGFSRKDNKKNTTDLIPYDIGRSSTTDLKNIPSTCDTTNSYIIYSDFNNVCIGTSPNKTKASSDFDRDTFVNSGVRGSGQEYFPYAVVNPTQSMGTGALLTGDGAKLNGTVPVAKNIVDDTTAHGYIGCFNNGNDSAQTAQTYAEVKTSISSAISATDDSQNKISTYKTEMPTASFEFDFPVVVINSEAKEDSTILIDNYIKVLTNSSQNYRVNNTDVYKINNIYACTYKNGKYSIDANATAGLKYSSSNKGQFYMEKGYADNNQNDNQISLIDVEFFDPNETTKVAYHLYIPVLTKKMISFSFKSASLSGTDYKASQVNAASPTPYVFGNKLAEEMGTWFTSYIVFTYPQSELQNLVDNGKGLMWNHNKTIAMNYGNTDGKLNDSTKLVLIDLNNNDQAYYSTLEIMRSDASVTNTSTLDLLNLSNFKTSSQENEGTAFVQSDLNSIVTVTAAAQSGGGYKVTTDTTKATVKAKLNGVDTLFEYAGESQGTHKLTVNGDGYERYFMSILTPTGSSLYNFDINCPKNISGTSGAPKGLRNDTTSSVTNIILGNLFIQTVALQKVALQDNESSWVVDSIYNKILVNVQTTITMANQDSVTYLTSHLNDPSIDLYHSFVLYLTKYTADSSTNIIGGSPTVTSEFKINGNRIVIEHDDEGDQDVYEGEITTNPGGLSYAKLETHEIKDYLINSADHTVIISSESVIDYSDLNSRINGFPPATSNGSIGVNVSAKSNLSYTNSEERLVFSGMTGDATPPSNKYYYIKESDDAGITYNAKQIDDVYDKDGILSKNKSQLGLNAKNLADETRTNIPLETVVSYNASNLNDFVDAKTLKCTLTLYKKTDTNDEGTLKTSYEQVDDLSDYFTGSIKLKSTDSSMSVINSTVSVPAADSVTFIGTVDTTKKGFEADIDYSAIIDGTDFNEYANYKVVFHIELLKADNSEVPGSSVSSHIIYTNAKINPSIVPSA